MKKSGRQYADEVRFLRESGFEFPASEGYKLSDAANWSPSLKGQVSREINRLDFEDTISESGISESEALQFFEDAVGDDFEEFDDINLFDLDEAEVFEDDESDRYTEAE